MPSMEHDSSYDLEQIMNRRSRICGISCFRNWCSPRHDEAFTLIELLVVVAIMLILMGISLKVISAIEKNNRIAQTAYVLEQTRNALEGYYMVKGVYPPDNPGYNDNIVSRRTVFPSDAAWVPESTGLNDCTGLVYHLAWINDPRKSSWQRYVVGVNPAVLRGSVAHTNYSKPGATPVLGGEANFTIVDGFGKALIYEPDTNDYSSYRLWSKGQDGKTLGYGGVADPSATNDDIHGIGDI